MKQKLSGTQAFLIVLFGLFMVRFTLPFLSVPVSLIGAISFLLAVAFVAIPVLALFAASSDQWKPKTSALFLVCGVILHVGGALAIRAGMKTGVLGSLLDATAQTGLMAWTAGLGVLVGSLIKDKNMLPPVAIFLAGFDMFLIFTPTSLPRKIMANAPEVFEAVASKVPMVVQQESGRAGIEPGPSIGPADFIFLAMFFVCLFRFNMRPGVTLRWILPVLIGYLLIVLYAGHLTVGPISLGMLPALLPIGLTIFLVNRKEFQLNKEEKIGFWLATCISIALAGAGIYQASKAAKRGSPAAPYSTEPGPAPVESGGTPLPAPPSQRP
jgi:hypothetical protein